ncbi:MAG: methionyl-tRNA formyltransferase [Clostridia bacterium]|nr:methionyl-tRNA formyltransferase [Clostridia bacterium]
MRMVFMGTPDYSVATLEELHRAGHEIVGVFAQPDKPVGRKRIMTAPPVKECAEKLGIKVYQPATLRDGEALEILKALAPEIIVVVAYGKILPKEILKLPKYGCVNGHASLLPAYRGASPIQWCIVCGEKQTGVTVMQMDEGMDTGDIISQAVVDIGEQETAEQLFDRLSTVSAKLMAETLVSIENGTATRQKQPDNGVSYAPILKKEMAELDFNKNATELYNAVRGYYSWPCAYFFLEGKRVKVIKSAVAAESHATAGTVVRSDEKLIIACGEGTALELCEIQPEGSRQMTATEWLRGKKIAVGTVIG